MRLVCLLMFAALVGASRARADYVTYTLTGTVNAITDTSSNHYVPTSIHSGTSTFVGTFSFENSAPGSLSGSNGFYRGTALNLQASVTIDGQYVYTLTTPTASDEIDIIGGAFEFFKRGPTVTEAFAPNPPFSHFEFLGLTQTNVLKNAQVTFASNSSAGVSDQQTSGAPYYFIGSGITTLQSVPEPSALALTGLGAVCLFVVVGLRRKVSARQDRGR
jgi:hypothetical protein